MIRYTKIKAERACIIGKHSKDKIYWIVEFHDARYGRNRRAVLMEPIQSFMAVPDGPPDAFDRVRRYILNRTSVLSLRKIDVNKYVNADRVDVGLFKYIKLIPPSQEALFNFLIEEMY